MKFVITFLFLALTSFTLFAQEDPNVEARAQQRELDLLTKMNSRLLRLDKNDPAYKTKFELVEKLNREDKSKVEAQNIADRLAAKQTNPRLYPNLKLNGAVVNAQGVQYDQLPADNNREKIQYERLSNNESNANQDLRYEPISAKKELIYGGLPPEEAKKKALDDQNKIKFTQQQSRDIAEGRQDLKEIEKNRQKKFKEISDDNNKTNQKLLRKQGLERELLANKQELQKTELLNKQESKKQSKLFKLDLEKSKAIAKSKDGSLTKEQNAVFALKKAKIEADMKKDTNKKLAAQAKVNQRPKQELEKRQLAEAKQVVNKNIKKNKSEGSAVNKSAAKEKKPIKKKIDKTIKSAKKTTKKATKKSAIKR